MQAADLGVLASHEEGLLNAILEIMDDGLQMVVTEVGGNSEAVKDKETGFIVPPGDSNKMSEALIKLIVNRALREKMGNTGRQRVQLYFNLQSCVEKYSELYRIILNKLPLSEHKEIQYKQM